MNPVRAALLYFGGVLLAWIGAWLVFRAAPPLSEAGAFGYWTAAKLLIWAAPALWLIRVSGRSFGAAMGFRRWRGILVWGLGAGLLMVLLNRALDGFRLEAPVLSWGLANAAIVAPVVEEVALRGGVLGALMRRWSFPIANTITAAMFVALHLPGWLFQDRLWEMLAAPLGGAASIFALGWAFGFIVHRARSVCAGIFAHALNNLSA